MSSFANWAWNGPGDVPGDLTIFYQRLQELWSFVKDLEANWKNVETRVDKALGDTTGSLGSFNTTLKQMEAAYAQAKAAFDQVLSAFTLATGTTLEVSGNLKAITADIENMMRMVTPPAAGLTHALMFNHTGQPEIITALRRWIFLAQATVMNQAQIFDQIRFKQFGSGEFQTDPDVQALPLNIRSQFTSSRVHTHGNDYILAVVRPNLQQTVTSDVGAGTIYFTVRDSTNISAVVNVVINEETPHPNKVYHGALNVTFAYRTGVVGQVISFHILEGTVPVAGAPAQPIFFITARILGGIMNEGHVWFVGRGLDRYRPSDGFTIVRQVAFMRSRPGTGRPCHGTLLNGLITDELRVYSEIVIEKNGELEVGDALIVNDFEDEKEGIYRFFRATVDALFEADVEIKGDLMVTGTLDMSGQTSIVRDVKIERRADIDDSLSVGTPHPTGNVRQTLNVQGNARVTQKLTARDIDATNDMFVDRNLLVGQRARVEGVIEADNIRGLDPNHEYVRSLLAELRLGHTNKALSLLANGRPVVRFNDGAQEDVAYLSDIASGIQFQRGITLFLEQEPSSDLNMIETDNGVYHRFEVGDTALVKGIASTNPAQRPALWRVSEILANGSPTWQLSSEDIYNNPPKITTGGQELFWTWQWFGFARPIGDTESPFSPAYILWNPNNPVGDGDWTVTDLNMRMFRPAAAQDQIDLVNGIIATIQPDWLEVEPVLPVPDPVPPMLPSIVPNPAFINNKPWLGMTTLSGGDWDAEDWEYDTIVFGGDFDNMEESINDSLTHARHQQIKNGIVQVMHGRQSSMPQASNNTAFTLKWCSDTNSLYMDTGKENMLLFKGAVSG